MNKCTLVLHIIFDENKLNALSRSSYEEAASFGATDRG